jgi:hypothetical protein
MPIEIYISIGLTIATMAGLVLYLVKEFKE